LGKTKFDESNGKDGVSSVSKHHDGFVMENHSDSAPEVTHPREGAVQSKPSSWFLIEVRGMKKTNTLILVSKSALSILT
jgi:hypothetical protein